MNMLNLRYLLANHHFLRVMILTFLFGFAQQTHAAPEAKDATKPVEASKAPEGKDAAKSDAAAKAPEPGKDAAKAPEQGKDAVKTDASAKAAEKPVDVTEVMPKNVPRPLKVGVTFILNDIINVDEKAGSFQADVDLTLAWNNPDAAFDPKKEGSTIVILDGKQTEAKIKTMWIPQIKIANLEKIVSNIPSMTISKDGSVVYVQRIKAQFKMHPDLRAFPFDTQRLTLYLDADKNTTSEVKFNQDQQEINKSGIREGVKLAGWTVDKVEFKHSLVRNASGSFYPRFEIDVVMSRISMAHLFAFAPLILIMLSPTILTLYNDAPIGARLGAWGASLLTLIATSFALNQKYPALESDSILPQIIAIVMGYQFLMIFISMTVADTSFAKKVKNPYLVPEIMRVLRWLIPLGFILLILSRVLLVGAD